MRSVPVAALILAAACTRNEPAATSGFGGASEPAASTTGASTGTWGDAPASTSTEASGSSTTGDASTAASSTASTSLPAVPDFGSPAPAGCKGKIDIIFAISSALQMDKYQERLIAAFPKFIDTIAAELVGFDPHILVIDNSWWGFDDCSLCQDANDCDPFGEPLMCGATIDDCDRTWGSGRTFSTGYGSSGRRCKLAGGRRYLTAEEPDLKSSFECLAQVGYYSGQAHEMDAVRAAVGQGPAAIASPEDNPPYDRDYDLNGPGGCNEGFLRDDALLLIAIIQNDYDQHSQDEPWKWNWSLRKAKGWDEDAVLALAITTDEDIAPNLCYPSQPPSNPNRMRDFMENHLKHGHMYSICAESYEPFFTEVVAEIGPLCDQFIPQ